MHFKKYCEKSKIFISEETEKEKILSDLIMKTDFDDEMRVEIEKVILYREKLMSTGIGLGIAIPHARLDNINKISIYITLLKNESIDYESIDNKPIRIVFMILVPRNMHGEYIKILSLLVSESKNNNLIDDLLKSENIDVVYERLQKI